jgi:hypothetical protein
MSPENLPMTFEAGARLLPTNLSGVVPEKLPSGISTRFWIGTVERACDTTPDNWPPALVRRTSHSPQRREPGIRVPCTVQLPSVNSIASAPSRKALTWGSAAAGRRMNTASGTDTPQGDRSRIDLLCHCGDISPPLQPPVARRVAVPWRGGQRSLSKVKLTVSPENCPVTVAGGARLDPDMLAGVLPEKLPSGISSRSCIGMAVLRACDSVPDNWPPALVRRTSHSPQKREPGTRVPRTVQVPSASWIAGAGAAGATAGAGETAAGAGGVAPGYWQALCTDTHAAISSKGNDP